MNTSANELLDLLGSDLNRRILSLTSQEERSADAIADRCEASLPTVYRHIDDLQSPDVLEARVEYDDEGNHSEIYTATLDSFTVTLEDGDLHLSVVGGVEEDESDRPQNVERVE